VSVRWRPLLSAHSRKRRTSDKCLTQSFYVVKSSKWRLSSWTFSFCGRRCFSAVSHPHQYSIATSDTVVPMNIEVPTKYPLSHNDRTAVLAILLHSESPMLYRPALHGNWSVLSLARRALKDKFPTPIPLTAVLPNRQVFLPDPLFIILNDCIVYKYWSRACQRTQRASLKREQIIQWCTDMFIHSLVFSLEGRAWQEADPSHVTGMALAHCILGKFLWVVCHCFPPPLDVPTLAARCLRPQRRERS